MKSSKKIKDFSDMTKEEKKKFFSLDMADRMIRVEQKVSAHFHKNVSYKETEYYNGMCSSDKEAFDSFIKNKQRAKIAISVMILLPVAILIVLNTSVTASVIKDNLGLNYSGSLEFFIWTFAMIFTILALYKSLGERIADSRYDSHLDVFDNINFKNKSHKRKVFK